MVTKKYLGGVVVLASALLVGCSVVKVSEAGKRIHMLGKNEVGNCRRVGTVTTSVLDNVLFIPRNQQKIQSDLDKLARDQAVLMNANTLVHVSTVEGEGNYIAYQCP